MPSPSPRPLERATPLFGSLVRVRVEDCAESLAIAATSAALRWMSDIHRLMSFHEPASELSLLNRSASRKAVRVSAHMVDLLTEALSIASASGGTFDPTVGALAVRAGRLPAPEGAPHPHPLANWRDIDLDAEARTVRFRRPLWLDLGGIAKGYAVDLAVVSLQGAGITQACVNAGGDLRVFGPRPETVVLDTGATARGAGRGVNLSNRSLASSGRLGVGGTGDALAAHFDGVRRCGAARGFVSVVAKRCAHADALTKVVLARGRGAEPMLIAYGASAAVCSPALRWSVGGAPF